MIGALSTDAVSALCRGVRNRVAGLYGLPQNHHIAIAMRRAQMHALDRALTEWRDPQTPQWGTMSAEAKRFALAARGFCANTLGRCLDASVKLNLEVTEPLAATLDGLLAAPPPGTPSAGLAAALGAIAEDAVIDELHAALPGTPPPADFIAFLRAADASGRPRFLALFGHYIAAEIKTDQPFHDILTQGQLAEVKALRFDIAEMLHAIQASFGALLRDLRAGVDRLETAHAREARLAKDRHDELFAAIMLQKEGVDPEKLRPIFDRLNRRGATRQEIIAGIDAAIAEFLDLARQAPAATNAGPDVTATLAAVNDDLRAVDSPAALARLAAAIAAREATHAEQVAAHHAALVPLLRRQAEIQHAAYAHAAAIASLQALLALDGSAVWDWIALGDIHRTIGASGAARAAFTRARDLALEQDPQGRDIFVASERLGLVLYAQGDAPAALGEYRKAMAIAERLAASDPGQAEWQRDLSVSHTRIGDVLLRQGDAPGALGEYRKGMAIRERLAASDPGQAEWQRDLSVSHTKIGDVLLRQGDAPGALGEYRKARVIHERLAASDLGQTQWQRDLSVSHERIGDVLLRQGDAPGALAEYRKAMAIHERLAASDPGQAEWQRDLSVSHDRIGDVLLRQGDAPGALAEYRKAMAIGEHLAASDPGQAEWQHDVSVSHTRIGDVLRRQGDAPGALAEYRKGMEIAERLAASDPGQAEWQRDLIVSLWRLANTDTAAAVAHNTRALAIARALADTGRLAPVDAWMIPELERRLRDLGAPPA